MEQQGLVVPLEAYGLLLHECGKRKSLVETSRDTFSEASVLYEEELSRIMRGYARVGYEDKPATVLELHSNGVRRARASVLTALGFFLGLNTQRSFWRGMEATAEAFAMHVPLQVLYAFHSAGGC